MARRIRTMPARSGGGAERANGSRYGRGAGAAIAALALLAAAVALPAHAQGGAERIEIDLTVCLISDEPGRIDPRAGKLVQKLKPKIRFESLEVLERKKLDLAIDDVGGTTLPNGRSVRVKPLLVDGKSALLDVDFEGSLNTQLRVKSDHLVVLGPQRHEGGQLVVSLEPHF